MANPITARSRETVYRLTDHIIEAVGPGDARLLMREVASILENTKEGWLKMFLGHIRRLTRPVADAAPDARGGAVGVGSVND